MRYQNNGPGLFEEAPHHTDCDLAKLPISQPAFVVILSSRATPIEAIHAQAHLGG
jgi:hypothetical protein